MPKPFLRLDYLASCLVFSTYEIRCPKKSGESNIHLHNADWHDHVFGAPILVLPLAKPRAKKGGRMFD